MSLLKKEYHTRIYFLGLCLMAVGIPLSRFTMSVAGLLLFGNWLFEGNLKRKISLFLRNKPALVFASLFLLHVIGLTYTSDFNYAIKDLRTKVPLFIFPLIFSSTPAISGAKFAKILKFYLLSVLGGTMAGVFILLTRVVTDPRELSPFISHIRFSLNVCLAITVILYLLIINTKEITLPWRYFLFTLLAWMFTYLYISQSFTGFFVMIALVLAWLIVASTRLPVPWVKESLILLAIAIPVVLFLYIRSDYKHYFNISSENISKLEWVTPGGHYYYHDPNDKVLVNGHRIWIFVCEDELREAWEKRSRIPYDSLGQSGLKISDVLLRYLTSRGLRKDAGGVKQLSDNEIKRIEEGIADIEETRGSPLHRRLSKI
ncbi:MAG: hypothetical protein NTU44_14735 [Bacteroidetes bacterium]|nr:hypothetical protein [Bacteroidota bacterium]